MGTEDEYAVTCSVSGLLEIIEECRLVVDRDNQRLTSEWLAWDEKAEQEATYIRSQVSLEGLQTKYADVSIVDGLSFTKGDTIPKLLPSTFLRFKSKSKVLSPPLLVEGTNPVTELLTKMNYEVKLLDPSLEVAISSSLNFDGKSKGKIPIGVLTLKSPYRYANVYNRKVTYIQLPCTSLAPLQARDKYSMFYNRFDDFSFLKELPKHSTISLGRNYTDKLEKITMVKKSIKQRP